MSDNTVIYCNCMKEVKQRIDLVTSVLNGSLSTGHEAFNIELIFIHLRKTLELIAFSSLTANKAKYSNAHRGFATHWKAKKMFECLEKINPNFYPMPLEESVTQENGARSFVGLTEGFLTKEDFVKLYDASSEVLHTRNPFSSKDRVIQIGYSVEKWVSRIQMLLKLHRMQLVDGNQWIVNITQNGPVNLYLASPQVKLPSL